MTRNRVADMAEEYARKLGAKHGENAAGWYEQDAFGGRVVDSGEARESAKRVLAMLEDGDPAVYDSIPAPDLSGQWAGDLTGPELARDAFAGDPDRHVRLWAWYCDACFSGVCEAYEMAFMEACEAEIARMARLAAEA